MKRMRNKLALLLATAMVVTSIQIPVYGATEETVTVTEVAEEAVVENTEVTEEVTEDAPVGADSTIYVRSAEELVSALNGENLPTNEKVQIQLQEPSAGYDYKLTKELLGGKNLTIKDGADITLDLNNKNVYVSENAIAYKIEVPKATSFSVTGNGYYDSENYMHIGIINRGSLNLIGVCITCAQGDALVNDVGAVTNLEEACIHAYTQDAVAVRNAGMMTIGIYSEVQALGASHVAIENTGEMLINNAYVKVDEETVSACVIKNLGANTNLSIRGLWNNGASMSSGYGIFNDAGTVTIGSYAEDADSNSFVRADKCAVLTVNGGTVIGYDGMHITGGVATTPLPEETIYTGTSDGVFKMLGGRVDHVIYSAESLPILVGGTVGYNDNKALVLVSVNRVEPDASKYFYLNEKDGTPIAGSYTENGEKKVTYWIQDGKVRLKETKVETKVEIEVKTEKELQSAVVSGGNIKLGGNVELTEELVLTKDASINLNNMRLIQASENAAITVKEGVTASIYGYQWTSYDLTFKQMKSDASVITNHGNLALYNISVGAESDKDATVTGAKAITNYGSLQIEDNGHQKITTAVKDGIAIDNAGTLNVNGNSYSKMLIAGSAAKDGMTALKNSGTCILRGGIEIDGVSGVSANDATAIDNSGTCTITSSRVSVYGYTGEISANRCVAVQNIGTFVMQFGTVRGGNAGRGEDNYAIVYTEDHYPVLIGGEVYGTAEGSASNPVYGSAVAKKESDGTYSRGYFQRSNSTKAPVIDGQNATRIEAGVPLVSTESEANDTYLLLQTGDVVQDIETAFSFSSDSSDSPGEYTTEITSSNPETASVSTNGTNWTLRANKAGYTVLKATRSLNGNHAVEDYLRIEVTDDKVALTAEDYEGSLLENQVAVNAYTDDGYEYEVPFEFHLDTSEMATGAQYSDFEGVQSDSFTISDIIIDDKEFNQYFEIKERCIDSDTKINSFTFSNIESLDGASTNLLEDEVKSITNVEVKAKIENQASQKDMLITLGNFDISVQAGKPVVKANGGYTLNSAYNSSAQYRINGDSANTYPNCKNVSSLYQDITAAVNGEETYIDSDNVSVKALSDGLSAVNGNTNYITAIAKKGKETITAEVTLDDYVGTYQVNVPVTITNKYPKVALNQKTVTVSQKSSAETDIPLYLYAKDAESAGMVENVEIVTAKGKTSNYTIGYEDFESSDGYAYWSDTLKGYEADAFCLQPKSILNKAETVTLKVTYRNTNAKAGKTYSTTVKVKVKPVSKFTVKQDGKATLCTNVGNETYVYFKTTPEYFKGAKLVVTKLNGQAEIPEEVDVDVMSDYANYYSINNYYVCITATENTKARGKKLEFGIAWMDENGQLLTGTKVAKMTVSLYEDNSKLETTEATITVQPEKIYKKYETNSNGSTRTVYNEFTAPLKITGKGEWYMTGYSDKMFDISSSGKKIVLEANSNIIAGTEYEIPLTFTNRNTQETKIVNLTVKVADVKKVTAKFDTDTVTLYKAAPYTMQTLYTGVGAPYVTAPIEGAGLTEITKVEIADANSPFELYEYKSYSAQDVADGSPQRYGITFKDKKYPTKASAKTLKTVTVKITYSNGIEDNYKTALVKLKVNVK